MASQYASGASLPQGFSVYQPQLGAQLQFFPALGTQELDDMMNAYIPSSALLKEKRATITLDFLEHSQLTGQTFKFYPVYYSSSPVAPVAASPVNSIAASPFGNTSPVNSILDWSQASASPSVSSRSSISKSRKASKSNSLVARYSAVDLSHLPGMKIMTKDGQDITDSASRGSKTKEQRDHAHLMRIIKACDSCRRKKIRCDPDHKKRSASQAQPQSATKSAKKARTAAAAAPPTPLKPVATAMALSKLDDNPGIPMSLLGIDPTFTFTGLDSFESTDQMCESWEEFVQYPPADVEDNYDFFLDPEGYLSSQSSASSSSASPPKAFTPASQQELLAVPGLEERDGMSSTTTSPQLPFLQDNHTSSANSYTDFNLFSPSSSFSEDDRMVPISSTRLLSPSQPSVSGSEGSEAFFFNSYDADGHALATDWSGTSAPVSPTETGLVAAADMSMPWYDPGHSQAGSGERDSRAGISLISPTDWVGGVRIAYPSGGSVTVTTASGSGMEVIANSTPPGRSEVSGSGSGSVSIAILGSDTSVEVTSSPSTSTALQFGGDIQDDSQSYDQSPTERGRISSESPAGYSSQLSIGQADFRTESTSQGTIAIAPHTLANAANASVQFSTGSEDTSSRVQTELLANRNVNSEVLPSSLQALFGATSNVLPGSAAHAAAGDDTMAAISLRAESAFLVRYDMSGTEVMILRSLAAQQLNGETNAHQQSLAPLVDNGIQPTSLLLLQAISSNEEDTRSKSTDLGNGLKWGQFILRQVFTTQTTAAILAAALVGATFASMVGLSAVFSFASMVLVMGSIFQRLVISQGVKASFGATPSTMSSPRSRGDVYRQVGYPDVRKARLSVLGHEASRLSSRFSPFLNGAMAKAVVAPFIG